MNAEVLSHTDEISVIETAERRSMTTFGADMKNFNKLLEQAKTAHWVTVRLTDKQVAAIVEPSYFGLNMHGENLTRSGAKLYVRGGGWYRISGYHYAGEDVVNDLLRARNVGQCVKYIPESTVIFLLSHRIRDGKQIYAVTTNVPRSCTLSRM